LTATASQAQSERPVPESDAVDMIIKLYPNPATTYVTFDLQKNTETGLSLQVYNFLGKKMYETPSITGKVTVNLSDFNRGVYIFHLRDQAGKILKSGKFQVTK
jgi:hypothetical protein